MSEKATWRQKDFITDLMIDNGYVDIFMTAKCKNLGATEEECNGTLKDWLRGLVKSDASHVIGKLQDE